MVTLKGHYINSLDRINVDSTTSHRRQSWGLGVVAPDFGLRGSWGSQGSRRAVVNGSRKITIAYFAQKVC